MRRISIVALLIFINAGLYSQTDIKAKPIELSIGLSDYSELFDYTGLYGVYNCNFSYKFSELFGSGFQIGWGGYKGFNLLEGTHVLIGNYLNYALTGNFNFTSLILKEKDPKINFMIKGNVGLETRTNNDPEIENLNDFSYGCYLHIAYFVYKDVGIYGEIGYGKRSYSQIGLKIRL